MKIKTWHFLAGWAVLFGLSIPPARAVRHLNQPHTVKTTTLGGIERADVCGLNVCLERIRGSGLTAYSQDDRFHSWGGGETKVVEDATTDEQIRLEVTYYYEHSLFRETLETHPVRSDLVLHVNPKGKYPTPGNPNVWVSEKKVKREALERELQKLNAADLIEVEKGRAIDRAKFHVLRKQIEETEARWNNEDAMRRAWRRMFVQIPES